MKKRVNEAGTAVAVVVALMYSYGQILLFVSRWWGQF